jgi:hypothetical protein
MLHNVLICDTNTENNSFDQSVGNLEHPFRLVASSAANEPARQLLRIGNDVYQWMLEQLALSNPSAQAEEQPLRVFLVDKDGLCASHMLKIITSATGQSRESVTLQTDDAQAPFAHVHCMSYNIHARRPVHIHNIESIGTPEEAQLLAYATAKCSELVIDILPRESEAQLQETIERWALLANEQYLACATLCLISPHPVQVLQKIVHRAAWPKGIRVVCAKESTNNALGVWSTVMRMVREHHQRTYKKTPALLVATLLPPLPAKTKARTQAAPLPLTHLRSTVALEGAETRNALSISASSYTKEKPMANVNETLEQLMQIDGATAVCLVDSASGMLLGKAGGGVNLDVAAAGNTEVVRAKLKTMKALGITGTIEDILITLDNQYHIIRLVPHKPGLFIYTVLDKAKANLAMARYKIMDVEKALSL